MKYKVIREFVLNGITQKLNSIIELDFVMGNLSSIQENIQKITGEAPKESATVLGSLTPGQAMTAEQKEKLAKENLAETDEAQRLAAKQRARDQAEGKNQPPVQVVADALKEKLKNEEFESKNTLPPEVDPNTLP